MVFGEPGDRVTELVGEPRLLRDLGKNLRRWLCGVARPHQIENAEFHRPLLCFACAQRWSRYPGASSPELSADVALDCWRSPIGGMLDILLGEGASTMREKCAV